MWNKLIEFEEAEKLIKNTIKEITATETVHLKNALGRVLAKDVLAHLDIPSFNRATMDGFALYSKDTEGASSNKPVILNIKGKIWPGTPLEIKLNSGECVKIATGATLPKGVDAVVKQEDVEVEANKIFITEPLKQWENVGLKGGDIKRGELLLGRGTLITPGRIAGLAACGIAELLVYKKPNLLIVASGSEIQSVGKEPLMPGKVFDINSYTILSLLTLNGACGVIYSPYLKDTIEDFIKVFLEAEKYDGIIFSGSTSIGERDLLAKAILEVGGEVIFHGVNTMPGKPTLFGKYKETIIWGLPGFPTSCFMIAYTMLVPALRKVGHLEPFPVRREMLPMGEALKLPSLPTKFITVNVKDKKVFPVFKGSSMISSFLSAQGYVVIPRGVSQVEKDSLVEVIFLQ